MRFELRVCRRLPDLCLPVHLQFRTVHLGTTPVAAATSLLAPTYALCRSFTHSNVSGCEASRALLPCGLGLVLPHSCMQLAQLASDCALKFMSLLIAVCCVSQQSYPYAARQGQCHGCTVGARLRGCAFISRLLPPFPGGSVLPGPALLLPAALAVQCERCGVCVPSRDLRACVRVVQHSLACWLHSRPFVLFLCPSCSYRNVPNEQAMVDAVAGQVRPFNHYIAQLIVLPSFAFSCLWPPTSRLLLPAPLMPLCVRVAAVQPVVIALQAQGVRPIRSSALSFIPTGEHRFARAASAFKSRSAHALFASFSSRTSSTTRAASFRRRAARSRITVR